MVQNLIIILSLLVSGLARAQDSEDRNKLLEEDQRFVAEFLKPLVQAKAISRSSIRTDPRGPLLGDADFEKRLWETMVGKVQEARETAKLTAALVRVDREMDEIRLSIKERATVAQNERHDVLWKESVRLRHQIDLAANSGAKIGGAILHLKQLLDARAVRLLAPLLEEQEAPSVAFSAANALSDLASFGVINADGVRTSGKTTDILEDWRTWWKVHRAEFGAAYELPKPHLDPAAETEARDVLARPKAPLSTHLSPKSVLDEKALSRSEAQPSFMADWAIWVAVSLVIFLVLAWLWQQRKRVSR